MANRSFVNEGFWDRVNEAIESSGMSKSQIADKMGVERKSLYAKGDNCSWHSGRLASFCKIVGVSADWLLGLSDRKYIASGEDVALPFKVVDRRTGKEPIYDGNHMFKEKWFKDSNLIYCDLDVWCITEDGNLILTDDCNNLAYAPLDKYKVVFL